MKLELIFATRKWNGWEKCVTSWAEHSPRNVAENRWSWKFMENDLTGQELLESYQTATNDSTADILGFLHDDLICHEDYWDRRVLKEFDDPAVGIVGFAGALGHGAPNLYTSPYHLPNLARQDFISNMTNAEAHGRRFTGECDVAILDGLALFVRREILLRAGGWDLLATYFMYSEWLCCEARRQGYRIRLVGCNVDHLGGKSSSMVQLKDDYQEAHRYFYENNRDVMPFRVKVV